MSANNSPTKLRRLVTLKQATELAYKLKGAEYRDNLNPYALNSFEFDRFRRFYIKAARSYHYFESRCDDLAAVYGEFRPDRLNKEENLFDSVWKDFDGGTVTKNPVISD